LGRGFGMNKTRSLSLFVTALTFLAVVLLPTGERSCQAAELSAPGLGVQKVKKKKKAKASKKKDVKMPALSFKMKDIDGKPQDLGQYYGDVVLMVNTASRCGFTPQYEGLEKVYEKYAKKGFVILAFPANNFGKQEPGPNDEIKQFCKSRFNVTFPLFGKVSVKGSDICDLYKYLTDKKADHKQGGKIPWNFTKFLVNRKGEVVARFGPRTKPEDPKLTAAIEKQIAAAVPEDSPLSKKKKTPAAGL